MSGPKEVEMLAQGFGASGPGPLVLGLPLVSSTRVAVVRSGQAVDMSSNVTPTWLVTLGSSLIHWASVSPPVKWG